MNGIDIKETMPVETSRTKFAAGAANTPDSAAFLSALSRAFRASEKAIVTVPDEPPLTGDVTFSRQDTNFCFNVDMSKPTQDMSLDEYKKYICNKISDIPVTAFTKTHVFGPVTITEECFAHMKSDPAYEQLVMRTMHMELTADFAFDMACYGEYVFGATEDEIGGTAYSIGTVKTKKTESYWDIRHERIMENLRLQAEKREEDERYTSSLADALLTGLWF